MKNILESLETFLIGGLFVLGGDFWDKVEARFIYGAKAQIPRRTAVPKYEGA